MRDLLRGRLTRRDRKASAEGARSEAEPSEAVVDPGYARIRTHKCRRDPLSPACDQGEADPAGAAAYGATPGDPAHGFQSGPTIDTAYDNA